MPDGQHQEEHDQPNPQPRLGQLTGRSAGGQLGPAEGDDVGQGIELVALSPAIAIQSTRLPGNLSGDPADGMLVATARANGARLVTRDRRLIDYAAGGHLAVLDATP